MCKTYWQTVSNVFGFQVSYEINNMRILLHKKMGGNAFSFKDPSVQEMKECEEFLPWPWSGFVSHTSYVRVIWS